MAGEITVVPLVEPVMAFTLDSALSTIESVFETTLQSRRGRERKGGTDALLDSVELLFLVGNLKQGGHEAHQRHNPKAHKRCTRV